MRPKISPVWLHAFASLSNNLAATCFFAAFLTRGFSTNPDWLFALLNYVIYGIVFLVFGVKFEEQVSL